MTSSIDLEKLDTDQLMELYSGILIQLKKRNIIKTNNLIGELGEYIAISHYCKTTTLPNLQKAPVGTKNIDAISRKGERYSIKSTTRKTTGVFYDLNPPNSNEKEIQKFEYVLIVKLDENFKLKNIIELDWNQFLKLKRWHSTMNAWNLSLTNKLVKMGRIVYP